MSHNYPYRRLPSDTDRRPEAGPYCSAEHRHTSPDCDFYRPTQESFSLSYASSSASRGSTSAQCSQDGALSILSSCGLEPSDLALLAELPEDVLTVESLPHVLAQIKGKRGTIRSFPPSTLSPPSSFSSSSSYRRPPVSSSTSDWDQLRSQPVQYPLDQVTRSPLLSEQDLWGNPRTSSSVRVDSTPLSSSTSRSVEVFQHRPGLPEYGKTVRATGPVSSQELPSFSSAGQGKRTRPAQFCEPRSANYRTAASSEHYHPKPRGGCHEFQSSSVRSGSRQAAAASLPSEKAALDFHGTCPTVFPYSCSLCDITVLSEKVWIKHINGTQHAEGQLTLLQQFPNWDCRLETVSRANNQSEKWKDEEQTSCLSQPASQNHKPQPNTKPEKKAEKSKVVCVRFPPQTVDEAYLRKLTEPFGKIIKILMFPSLAFVELGSVDQAKDLVKFHVNYPPTVNGEKIEFRISNTFNFLQSSRVVSFTPVPRGEDSQSDLVSIIKCFGPPLYTLFLPSVACVEMKNASDAQKLVDYYSSNTLRINSDYIKVALSGEYKTLMRVPSAKRYEEKTVSTKRMRSLSQEKDESKRRSSSSKDREQEKRKSSKERQSRSREKSSREKRTRTRSKSREKSREKSDTERKTRSSSRDKSRETSSRGTRTRSRKKSRSSSKEKTVEAKTPDSMTEGEPSPLGEAAEKQQTEEKAELSAGESDIEGMEVIGEDGENVQEEDVEMQDDTDGGEEEEAVENSSQAERTDSPEEDKEKVKNGNEEKENICEMKKQEVESETSGEKEEATEAQLEDEQEPDFPVNLENCITLDELEDDQSDDGGEDARDEARDSSTRVIYFKDLPSSFYTDTEFIKLVRVFGKPVRYLLIRRRQEGFIEMSSPSEARRAARELSHKSITLSGSKVNARISHRYYRLSNGWEIPSDSDKEKMSQSSSRKRSERLSKSKTSDRDETCGKSEGKESSKKTQDQEMGSKTSTDKMPNKASSNKKTQGNDLKSSSKKESHARKTPEKNSESKKSTGTELSNHKTEEKEVKSTVKKESDVRKSPKKEASDKKTPKGKPDIESPNKRASQESVSRNDPDKESLEKKPEEIKIEKECDVSKSQEKESDIKNTSEKSLTPDKESSSEKTSEEEPLSEKTDMSHETKNLKRKGTSENNLIPEKTPKKESYSEKSGTGEKKGPAEETPETEEGEQKSSEGQGDGLKEQTPELAMMSPHQPDSTEDLQEQTKQEADGEERPRDTEEAVQVEDGCVPAGDATDQEKPTKPVGTEFVRPVVGYFCNLCQVIYADEDEAKLQHCSSLMHYRKYQETTGKDPWSS